MDRRTKLLIIGGAWFSALLLVWFLHSTMVAPKVEKQVALIVAARDLATGTLVRAADLKTVSFPERVVPKGALLKAAEAESRVVMFPVNSGEPLLAAKLSAQTSVEGVASLIDQGMRAVSVQISDVTGVAGLIQANSHVDVLFTRPGNIEEAATSTILQNVKVLSVGKLPATGQTADPKAPRAPVVTLVLSPEAAQKLELAKSEGKISLSLRNPLDHAQAASAGPVTTDALDASLSARVARAKLERNGGRKTPAEDPATWQRLQREAEAAAAARKKEAEKPRAVVDVFRGDKHVQEVFK
jgi:pilus assembly protein CpaB